MIVIILLSVCFLFFIENRLAKRKQIHIHFLCIVLYSLYTITICNTLLCIILIYWFIRTIKADGNIIIRPFIIPLTIIAVVLFATGVFSIYALTPSTEGLLGSVFRDFIVILLWPIIISYTIKDINNLQKFVYFYAVARIFEVGMVGIIIYLFYYQQLWILNFRFNLHLDMLDLDHPARLLTIGAPNSNDAAFALLGAFGFVAYRLFYRIKMFDLFLCSVAFFGMLFTWTRSVWPFVALYFLIIMRYGRNKKKFSILFFAIIATFLTIFTIQSFQNEKTNDERLQSNDNFIVRKQQTTDYLSGIFKLPFFWGLYDEPKIVAAKLGLKNSISSENYTLETFTKHGIFAGIMFVCYFLYFIVSFWKTTNLFVKVNKRNQSQVSFVIALFAVFICLFLMMQTSLFRNNQIIWIMVGFMSVIRQQTYINKA